VAELRLNNAQLSDGLQRTLTDDSNLLEICKNIAARATDDSSDKGGNHSGGKPNSSIPWIGQWVDKPVGERGRKN
jgi:hypothetical protein